MAWVRPREMGQYPQPHNDKSSLEVKVTTQQTTFDTNRNISGGNAADTNDAVNRFRALYAEESHIGKNVVDEKFYWVG